MNPKTADTLSVRGGVGLTVDLFAGGGGMSCAFHDVTGRHPDVAANHDAEALAMHAANHPPTLHLGGDIRDLKPLRVTAGRPTSWVHGSPDCKDFSRAKGSAPRRETVRALANVLIRWAEETRPDCITLENVQEFAEWGPVDARGERIQARKGENFRAWCRAIERAGYRLEWDTLNAADFGAATTRKRLFLVAQRIASGHPIVWPSATHGPGRAQPWRSARDVIDFSLPCPSIFGRAKPLAENTLRRIARALTTHGHAGLIQTGYGEREGQAPRSLNIDAPLGTIMAGGNKHALVACIVKNYGGHEGSGLPIGAPLGTITTVDHHSLVVARAPGPHAAECRAWLDRYVGRGAMPEIDDIGLRMLTPRELYRAQGFPESYVIDPLFGGVQLTLRAQQKMVGNSVSPPPAAALLRANLPPYLLGEVARVA